MFLILALFLCFYGSFNCIIAGLQCLYPLSQSDSAIKLSRMMAAIAPKGPAAPIMMNELTSDLEELEFIKNDHRRFV